ncbi:uncharacterized protein LOC124111825 isoform X3 [Haliotis rufescens]|uniref:uncharacterized protein LOC124111825 isoform X3 n=1 Tax=Haliotis rufescens TaxID=6454 RepID=UPI001EAF973C|nr:uncharacterized protein LOC124111825 isoform X3 [Haliotis rufescens]
MWTLTFHLRLVHEFVLLYLAVIKLTECNSINWGINQEDMSRSDFAEQYQFDNGAAPLLIEAFTDELLRQMTTEPHMDRLSMEQAQYLKDRLKGLYAFLKNHPALMDRRLKVGSRKPQIPQKNKYIPQKRTFQNALSEPVCPSRTEWRLLRSARDINDTEVEIFQPPEGNEGHQWFYTVTCNTQHEIMDNPECPACCRGIHRTRYWSRCMPKKSYVMALVRRPGDTYYDWNWIQVESSCNCAISPFIQGRI